MTRVPRLRARREDDRGLVLPFVAVSIVVLLVMTSFSIDLGRLILRRREMQSVADVAALNLVRHVDGRTVSEITGDSLWAATIADTLAKNEHDGTAETFDVDLGFWDGSTFTAMSGAQVPNAVRTTAGATVDFFFTPGSNDTEREAVSTTQPIAGFSVGSFALGVDTENSDMLDSLLNDALDVTLVGYEGLADANINLGDLAAALGFGTPSELFESDITMEDFLLASAEVLQQQGNAADAAFLESLALAYSGGQDFSFGDVVSVEQPGDTSALDSNLNVLDLLAAAAFLANGSSAIGIPNTDVNIGSGILTVSGSVSLIEPPQAVFGPVGAAGSTKQVTLTLTANGNMTVGALGLTTIDLSLTFSEAAQADAAIADIICGGSPQQLDVGVINSLTQANMTLGVNPLGALPPPRVPLTGTIPPSSGSETATFIVPPDVLGETVEETGSGPILLSGMTISGGGPLGALFTPVRDLIVTPLLTQLDSLLVGPLADLLGLNVAGSDIVPLAIDCTSPQLVA